MREESGPRPTTSGSSRERAGVARELTGDAGVGQSGELFVVPKGVEHKPFAAKEVKLLLIEPRGIQNTGHAGGERTAANDVWI